MRGYVLAGGASMRMGTDKARLLHEGRPTAVHLLELMRRAGLEATLIRRGPEDESWVYADGEPVRVLREPEDGPRHPLNGVATALDDARGDVLVLPCDVPFLELEDITRLVAAGPCVAEGERVHPLVAVIPWSSRAEVEVLITQEGPARALVRSLRRVAIQADRLFDRNTPQDLGVHSPAQRGGEEP